MTLSVYYNLPNNFKFLNLFVCSRLFSHFLLVDVFSDIQEAYLCAWIQLMEMVLIHILFLQHLTRLCKIHLTAGWEHSYRDAGSLDIRAAAASQFLDWLFSIFCFSCLKPLPLRGGQVWGASDMLNHWLGLQSVYFHLTLNTHSWC